MNTVAPPDTPTLCYWHNGHEITTRLRGLDIYRAVARTIVARGTDPSLDVALDTLNFDVFGDASCSAESLCEHRGDPDHRHPFHVIADNTIPGAHVEHAKGHPYRPEHMIIRLVNPGDPRAVTVLNNYRRRGATIMVDVTFPVHSPEMIIGFEPVDSPLHELDTEANREYWRPGGHAHTALLAAIRMAHVVTVNNEQTALDVLTLNPSVMVVPDLVAGHEASMDAALLTLTTAQNRAIRLALDPQGIEPVMETLRGWL